MYLEGMSCLESVRRYLVTVKLPRIWEQLGGRRYKTHSVNIDFTHLKTGNWFSITIIVPKMDDALGNS